ncbi:hypothetical protein RhiirA5_406639 [Rhizophagus irregularis]|uniref:Uncharacterized protein n=1 Tax=Rhizophagus irregularis TaxID=588596 RepID=A0A2N0QCF3_9GLOM|nr:hypothetical protein RhiirA5_406639 [Rhizophagus irregularis]PKC73078.1 hypothetical protein RhiirA1_451594 [Rhizophagus irregularis]GET61298.1 hypothetical protein RIR_jg27929.t1 [Rhizophagus irregularis DAOM 181602=DAOM 197198]
MDISRVFLKIIESLYQNNLVISWYTFKSELFRKNKIKATTPRAQKKCAEEYTLLNETERNQTAEELSKNQIGKEPS